MKRAILLIISFLLVIAPAHAQKGGVAILDIDAVARELGVEAAVKASLQKMQDGLNADLKKAQANLQAQMKNVETQAGPNPTKEQQQQLLRANQQLNQEFNRMKAQAQQTLQQERVTQINQFRDKLKPIALAAAKTRGLDVVIMKVTPPIYAYSDGVDITADTTARAVKAGLKEKAPPSAAPVPSSAPSKPTAKPEKAKPNQ